MRFHTLTTGMATSAGHHVLNQTRPSLIWRQPCTQSYFGLRLKIIVCACYQCASSTGSSRDCVSRWKHFSFQTVDAWLAWLMVDRAIIMCGLYSQLGDRCLNASNSAWRCAGVSRWSWAKLTLSGNAQPPACTVCDDLPLRLSSLLTSYSIDGGQWSAGSILTSLIRNSVERALGMNFEYHY